MNIYEQLIRDEGLRLKPYRDTMGKLTIGVGRNLDGPGITEAEAQQLLVNDVAVVEEAVRRTLPWTAQLSPTRQAVLINMGFNLGVGGLLRFRLMLDALKDGNYHLAAREMLSSLWATQVGVRARRLAAQLEFDQWQ